MGRAVVKLELELGAFREEPFVSRLERCQGAGIRFESLQSVGDTPENRRRLYDLNKICSADIPARGEFFTFADYEVSRFASAGYDPEGVTLAIDRDASVGMSATSNWSKQGFAFNEMTGVLRKFRGQSIALALKLLGIRFARECGAATLYTVHDFENTAAIQMNRRLGFVDAEWDRLR